MVNRRGLAGYNLVALVVAVTLLNIAAAAAMPLWSTAIRRDREEELLSRGLQYAEAIRVFQRRFGRMPNRLDELLEVKPRCVRQLWKDPITDSRRWGLVRVDGFGVPPMPPAPPGGAPGPGSEPPEGGEDDEPPFDPDSGEVGKPGGGLGNPQDPSAMLPIRGVHSRSRQKSIKTFFNSNRYHEWKFTYELLMAPLSVPGQLGVPRVNAETIGRPFRVLQPGVPAPGSPPGFGVPGMPPQPQPQPQPGEEE